MASKCSQTSVASMQMQMLLSKKTKTQWNAIIPRKLKLHVWKTPLRLTELNICIVLPSLGHIITKDMIDFKAIDRYKLLFKQHDQQKILIILP